MILVATTSNPESILVDANLVATNMDELLVYLKDKRLRKIVFKDDFVDKYFTSATLSSFIAEAKKLNKFLTFDISPSRMDLSYDAVKRIMSMSDREDLIRFCIKNQNSLKLIKEALSSTVDAREQVLQASSKMSVLNTELNARDKECNTLKSQLKSIKDNYAEVQGVLDSVVSRINNQHGINMPLDKLAGYNIQNNNFHKILYLKEVTRVRYVDTLIYYLQEILGIIEHKRARLLVLESRDSYGKDFLYPRCKEHLSLTYKDIAESDIFLAGYQHELVEKILNNTSEFNYLIVLDRTGSIRPYLSGDKVEVIHMVSTPEDLISVKDVNPNNVISYRKNGLHIPNIKGFKELGREERLAEYSNMEITQELIRRLEE